MTTSSIEFSTDTTAKVTLIPVGHGDVRSQQRFFLEDFIAFTTAEYFSWIKYKYYINADLSLFHMNAKSD